MFIRNLLYSPAYNPSIVAWVDQSVGCFKVFFFTSFFKVYSQASFEKGSMLCDVREFSDTNETK